LGTPTYTLHLRPAHAHTTLQPTHPPTSNPHPQPHRHRHRHRFRFLRALPCRPPPRPTIFCIQNKHYLLYCILTLSFVYSLPLPLPSSTAQLTFHDKVYARKLGRNDSLCAIDDRGSEREQEARLWRGCVRSCKDAQVPCTQARCVRTHRPAFVWPRQHLWSVHTWNTAHTQHGNLQGGGRWDTARSQGGD
jgi:hypothetical protein